MEKFEAKVIKEISKEFDFSASFYSDEKADKMWAEHLEVSKRQKEAEEEYWRKEREESKKNELLY